MFIEIRELEVHPVDFEEAFRPGAIELGNEVRQRTPLAASGRAQLVEEQHGKRQKLKDIRVEGRFSTSLELPCARCLEPVAEEIARSFDLLYRPQGADAGPEERAVGPGEAEISYYEGQGLWLEDLLREQLLLAVPLKAVCREDCRGLCPTCGTNLNAGACECTQPISDPRWAALKDLSEKLKH